MGVNGFTDEVRTRLETTKINNVEVQYFRDSQYADGEPSVIVPSIQRGFAMMKLSLATTEL
ncbi:hypothetical protein B1B04_09430 [Lysinibacillus sp. KCTC 33748]|nr:hypothetical protein B1B04_09430 [Lysinibacillus sp. KCTC 33748]